MHDTDDFSSTHPSSEIPLLHEAPHEAPARQQLTGHVSQLPLKLPTRHTSPSSALPTHPFALNFPTLNDDGSVDDLTAHQSRLHYPPTPPAALSSLGARAKTYKMNKDYPTEPQGSFTDREYDMIDDLSEISNDDHDTASIASNNDDGQLTPDDTSSEADPSDSTILLNEQTVSVQSSSTASLIDPLGRVPEPQGTSQAEKLKAENDIIDSYMSEDLETPRQSTVTAASPNIYNRYEGKASSRNVGSSASKMMPDERTKHILFISDRNVYQSDMDMICAKVASTLSSSDAGAVDSSKHKMVRLPATPSGIGLPSATLVCGADSVSATIQHCVYAAARAQNSYKLRILDFDREHSSFFTVGQDAAKIDLHKPDIAILYLDDSAADSAWIADARKAMQSLRVPILIVKDSLPIPALGRLFSHRSQLLRTSRAQRVVEMESLVRMDDGSLATLVRELLTHDVASPSNGWKKNLFTEENLSALKRALFRLFVLLLLVIVPWSYGLRPLIEPATNPATELAARREGLVAALSQVTNSSNIAQDFDVSHLVPSSTASCTLVDIWGRASLQAGCVPDVPFQGTAPNHLIVSFPVKPVTPRITSTRLYRADGRQLAFNKTKLIEGIYDVTFDVDEAHGNVHIEMLTESPKMNFTASHNFGSRMLQRKTYEKVGTDVGKAVSKDVAVMRHTAKTFREKLSTELGAGMWATRNVTTQLALYMARDLQVIGNSAVSIFGKAAHASNKTASNLSQDFVLMRKDLVRFTKDLSTVVKSRVQSAKANSKSLIKTPLALSRERLQGLRNVLAKDKRTRRAEHKVPKGSRKVCEREGEEGVSCGSVSNTPKERTVSKRAYRKAAQELDAVSKRVQKQGTGSEKKTRAELKHLNKGIKKREQPRTQMQHEVPA